MWKIATAAVIAGLVLAGCGNGSDTSASMPEPAVADGAMGVPAEVQKQAPVVERAVITTGQMSIRVEAVPDSVRAVREIVAAKDGQIDFEDLSSTADGAYATITARVPSANLESLIAEVSALGDVEHVSRQASDVTQQTVDLDARIAALEASIDRLRALLQETTNVADLVSVETEMSNRQAELDSLTAQRTYLANQVAMSTLTVSLQQAVSGVASSPGFIDGIRNGWNALVTLAGALVTSIGFLLPFVAIGLIGLAAVWLLLRALRRRRS